MNDNKEIKNQYLRSFELFENSLNGDRFSSISGLRQKAFDKFSELDFPTIKDEEWKYTSLAPLLQHNFIPSIDKKSLSKEQLNKFLFDGLKNIAVVINGHFSEELSSLNELPAKVEVKSIAKAIASKSTLIEKHFGKYADFTKHIFTSLSTAFTKDGVLVHIPKGIIVEEPIHIIFITDSEKEKLLIQPRNLFVADKNSQATIIEHFVHLNSGIYFTNTVTEIVVGENAILDHVKLQEESKSAFHISRMEIDQERASNFSSHFISLGASLSRNDFNSRFNDEGGECTLNGLFLTEDNQLFDVHTLIDHAKPHCNSHEHYKGILNHTSRGVFNGKVIVRQDAQKTNAFQENNNIILSNEALVNTKPQLEIFADDVKCSHGATIGQLDKDAMFYLKSRGLGEDAARSILIHAFASDVVRTIKVKSIYNYIEEILNDKFNFLSERN
ncbi:MAG TPA: Fe-S cluster assembly protein SufD [Ignavibacteriaceae bacterium]|nr:Fe-S cluster assembly protein SufD [Ignavibacteriaceae bacterium]